MNSTGCVTSFIQEISYTMTEDYRSIHINRNFILNMIIIINTLHAEGHFIVQRVYSISAPWRATFVQCRRVCTRNYFSLINIRHSQHCFSVLESSYIDTVGLVSVEASPTLATYVLCVRLECYCPIRSGHFTALWL